MTFIQNQIQNTDPQTQKPLPCDNPFQNTIYPPRHTLSYYKLDQFFLDRFGKFF